jgi:peptidyl-prolyl cis-trans isomerase C
MTGETVLTIDGKPVSKDFIDALTAQIPPRQLEMMKSSGQFKDFVEQMAMGQVLYDRAVAEKMYEDEKVKFKIAIAERDAIIKEYMNRASLAAVTPEALQKAYDDKASMYKRAQAKVRHILLKDGPAADALAAQIKGGGDFAALAREKSEDAGSGQKGGDLGWISNGQISKEFSEAAFAANVNDVIGPIQDRTGFHIIQVTEKRDGIPLDEVKDQLETVVKQESLKKLFEDVKAAAKIEWKIDPGGPKTEGGAPGIPGMPPGRPGGPTLNLGGPPPGAPAGAAPGAPGAAPGAPLKLAPVGSPPPAAPGAAPAAPAAPASAAPASAPPAGH